ncbi:MAG: STAS/SEC14 domain-containing protein [Phycisphaerales bacterium]
MFDFNRLPGSNIIEFTIDGPFTRADFNHLVNEMEAMIDEYGQIKVIEIIRHIGKIEPSAMWEDMKWSPRHLKHFSHAAIVADQKWIEWMTAAVKPFISTEVRFFHLDELEEAREWLKTVEPAPVG